MPVNDDAAELDGYSTFLDELVTDVHIQPVWSPDGGSVAFLCGPAPQREAWRVNLSDGARTPLFDVEAVRKAIDEAGGATPPGTGVPFEFFEFLGPDTIGFPLGGEGFVLELSTSEVGRLPGPGLIDQLLEVANLGEPRMYPRSAEMSEPIPTPEMLSPDGRFLLSTRDHDIAIRPVNHNRSIMLTHDGTPEHEWCFDQSDPRSEATGLGGGSQASWSPDGARIAVRKVDHRGVPVDRQVWYRGRDVEVVEIPHSRAGGALERITLHVLDVYGGAPVEIALDTPADTHPMFAGWLPDSSAVLIFQIHRDCRRIDLLAADPATGAVRPLFTEVGETFLRMFHDVYFERKLGVWPAPDSRHLVWASERSGWNHLYLYDLDGRLVRQLTDGAWRVDKFIRIHEDMAYFTARHDPDRPYDVHVCRVPLEGGPVERLTVASGVHDAQFAPSNTAFLDSHSRVDRPPVHELRRMDGSLIAEIGRADIGRLEEFGHTPAEEFTVTAADGVTQLWGVMFKPHDFDPDRSYPIVEHIYGGPQVNVAPHHWFTLMDDPLAAEARQMARKGYITVILDARGTPGRSKAFHDEIYGRWANCLADDHAGAIKQLAERHSFIDGDRAGITGHSWGGYSAFRCLADRPDVYRAAVSSAPGFDPYVCLLYECYLGLPQQNPEGYAFASTYPLASAVEGAFMLAVGSADAGCVTEAVRMSEALIQAGKVHDFVILPEQRHIFDSLHMAYFERKMDTFFRTHLA
ncbi:S9 family peptidase [Nonomuraea endophytica]|uniref:Dipeptidyl aminopeptidase/acylaminoacyl peptidase n=1 Tax=Nonomuraea endophytica TaxID=714136 RepID=A0A7W8A8F2_9ACTN|nr:DPP IV N-terminal domain-containing protein [Nonomuraea endophytica]MBB5081494.1 dipeptidyl aminopeptidase/acylaminoacyl peptidase [Nonomuraea endophytica]